jgi:putative ABC transport system permease protein
VRDVMVSAVIDDYMGLSAYMELGALHSLMREGGTLSGAYLEIDPAAEDVLYARLKRTPRVAAVNLKRSAVEAFQATIQENLSTIIFFNVLFSSVIAVGVVYNAARISLSERSRELASLRVLGFRRSEISFILLGELALLTCLAVPVGLLLGLGFAAIFVQALSTELYRFPLVVSPATFAAAALTVMVSASASALVVRRRLDRLDLVAVLKARE